MAKEHVNKDEAIKEEVKKPEQDSGGDAGFGDLPGSLSDKRGKKSSSNGW